MNTGEFFDKVESLYKDWQYDHPRLLHGLIRLLKPKAAIEVGTYLGYGACYMARAMQENGFGKLYCIDNWQLPNPKWRAGAVKEHFEGSLNQLGLRGMVTLIEGNSESVTWPAPIEFAYIDGWHSYKTCLSDWLNAVRSGAKCICFDDALSVIGPRLVIEKHVMPDGNWNVVRLPSAAGMAICCHSEKMFKHPITFSQETVGHPGMDVAGWPDDKLIEHCKSVGTPYP